ncbi:hypothetical protein ID866_5927 [Astraeus odoratus]|nr:hypothetical protein ID866_5927 [Astraeus odoratus]
MATASTLSSTTVLGKRRKSRTSLILSAGNAYTDETGTETDIEMLGEPSAQTATSDLLSLSEPPAKGDKKTRYPCTYAGCTKSYSKPSRLSEHYRSHTGERPFVCQECGKSYLRESHLHAHKRSHLPESKKPYVCTQSPGCQKRFWTLQHLHVHEDSHRGEKPYACTEDGCKEAFAKHHQLRAHVCEAHSPPGTKPYICTHPSCKKSFPTNQKLRGHMKTHEDNRYMCSHPNCIPGPDHDAVYFGTWTSLQAHIRTAHPPTCIHESCKGRTFASHHNLRAHLKLHEQREAEAMLLSGDESDDEEARTRKRRRGGELGRDWKCDYPDCGKDFKSKRALTTHNNVIHLGQRNHACPHPNCNSAFGYKHLLERHLTKIHSSKDAQSTASSAEEVTDAEISPLAKKGDINIDDITGKTYAHRLQDSKLVRCPYPHIEELLASPSDCASSRASSSKPCDHVLSRAYDLRRHLKAEHGVVAEKEKVDRWTRIQKRAQAS